MSDEEFERLLNLVAPHPDVSTVMLDALRLTIKRSLGTGMVKEAEEELLLIYRQQQGEAHE